MPRLPLALLVALGLLAALSASSRGQGLPPAKFPAENPFSEEKRVLGKLLFFEEQLSSDNTMACGTCHVMGAAGADPRKGRHPGPDGVPNTLDDKLASRGVVRSDSAFDYQADPVFGFEPQVTFRAANALPMAAHATELFWDGAAGTEFVDPETGLVAIAAGGALESQVLRPPLSTLEMGHAGRDWPAVAAKLSGARPLALATDLPSDMAQVLASQPTYPDLFQAAFGTPEISARRIAFAIATYERTLVPDQTPWDRFTAGNKNALTPKQQRGLAAFNTFGSQCFICHPAPDFTDHSFRNIGLRPWQEDNGRMAVTGNFFERGMFKVPSLRNVGLKQSFMHNGGVAFGAMEEVADVVDFYRQVNGHFQFPENKDPEISILNLPAESVDALVEFLVNGLTDPRVAAETFPFDRPTLFSERTPRNPLLLGTGTPGQGGFVPEIIARSPPLAGSADFRIGIHAGRGGALAFARISTAPPGQLGFAFRSPRFVLSGNGPGAGHATWHWRLPGVPGMAGSTLYVQWFVADPAATGGFASSAVARLTLL